MDFMQAIVLGMVQGLTEFLPVSSSGHLTIVPIILGWEGFDLTFDVALHFGTLIATIAYFRHDVMRILKALVSRDPELGQDRRLGVLMIAATISTVIMVLVFEQLIGEIDDASSRVQGRIVGASLLVTTTLLLLSEYMSKRRARSIQPIEDASTLSLGKAIFVGVAQGFTPLPGLSRSGTTMAAGLFMGMKREESARFSFLLSIPIIFAAVIKKLVIDLLLDPEALSQVSSDGSYFTGMALGVFVTIVVSYAAIKFMLPFVRKHSLGWFAAYTSIVGIGMLVWSLT